MTCVMIGNSDVGLKFVRVDSFGFIFYCPSDKVMDGFLLDVRNLLNTDFATSLDGSRNPGLIPFVGTAFLLCLAANKRPVNSIKLVFLLSARYLNS